MLESDYPYKHSGGQRRKKCEYDSSNTYGTVKSWYAVSKNEDTIAATLAD